MPNLGFGIHFSNVEKKLLDNGSKKKLTLKHYPKKSSIRLNEFEIDTIQNSHSVPQSVSLLIKTKKILFYIQVIGNLKELKI